MKSFTRPILVLGALLTGQPAQAQPVPLSHLVSAENDEVSLDALTVFLVETAIRTMLSHASPGCRFVGEQALDDIETLGTLNLKSLGICKEDAATAAAIAALGLLLVLPDSSHRHYDRNDMPPRHHRHDSGPGALDNN